MVYNNVNIMSTNPTRIFKNKLSTRFFTGLILTVFLFSLLVPQKTNAYMGVVDVVVDPTNLVQNTVSAVANPITATMTTLEKVKHYVLDPLAWAVAKRMINRLTVQTVNWINSGFQGNPAYLTEPGQFFLNVGDDVASKFLSETSLSQLCTPFKAEVRLALLKNYLSTDSSENYSCRLDILKNNYDQFTQDFSVGGWDGWFEVTQNSQNNPYGVYIDTQNQLAKKIGESVQKYQKQLDYGDGFFSFEVCPQGQTVTQQQIDDGLAMGDPNYVGWKAGDCWVKKETSTPGKVIEQQLEGQLGSGIRQLELADSFNEIVSALVTQLVGKITAGGGNGGGLRGAATGDPTFVAPPPENPDAPTIIFPQGNPVYVDQDMTTKGLIPMITALAVDSIDGDISSQVSRTGTVDTSVLGTYTLTYTVTNSRGITTTATLTVIVGDPTIPGVTTPVPGQLPPNCTANPSGNGGYVCTPPGGTVPPPTTPGGSNCINGVGNDAGAPSTIDPNQIIWGDADISGWPVTANLSGVSVNTTDITLNYDKANVWPNIFPPWFNGAPVVGNAWVVVWRNGAWHASTFEWLRPGQTTKGLDNLMGADGTLASPLGNFSPKAGQLYGFVVSTPARGGQRSIDEKSNVVSLVWPSGIACPAGSTTPPPTTPPPPPTTPPPGPGIPVIISISPTTATAGTAISITGTNLQNTSTGAVNVQFIDYQGTRNTVVGSVSGGGTQATVFVPTGLVGPSGYLRIDNGAGLISNSVAIQIPLPPLPSTQPTSSIRPQVTLNGWWPHLSPSGRYVAYGDWGGSWVYDLTTGTNYDFSTPADLASDTGHSCIGGFWITPTKMTYVCQSTLLPRDHVYRYEVDFSGSTPGSPVRTSDDPAIVAGNQFMAEDGHWVSWLTSGFRLAKDNAVIATGVGGAVAISQNQIVHACDNSNANICLRNGTTLSRTFTSRIPLHQMTITDGYILYGGYGGLHGITPTGTDVNLLLSPSYMEGAGNAPGVRTGAGGQVFLVNGTYWVATVASGPAGNYIFIRPWGSTTAIIIQADAVSVDVAVSGTNFIVAYNNDRGGMAVLTVPINSSRDRIP